MSRPEGQSVDSENLDDININQSHPVSDRFHVRKKNKIAKLKKG